MRTASGQLNGAVLVFRDITERKRAETQLAQLLTLEAERSQRLRQVAAASLTLNTADSASSVLGVVGAEARQILGAEHAEVHMEGHGSPPSASMLSAPLVGRGGHILGHLHLSGKSQGKFNEDDKAVLLQLAHMAAVALENTRLYEEVRESDRRKDEFLATLAHELRNPLAPLEQWPPDPADGQAQGDPAEQARDMMERQLRQIVRLVDDLLDVSRISRGKIELKRERVELASVIRQAVEVCRPQSDCAGLDITLSLPPEPVYLYADSVRLTQVFSNLLNNACKYSGPSGPVRLTATTEGGNVVVSVADTGIGIPPAVLARVFDMFFQVDNSLEKSQGGLGIGLTLVKRLVEMHGGTVEAHSEGPGKGSEFVVRLPLAPAVAAPPTDPADASAQNVEPRKWRILVVDDNRDSAETLGMLLPLERPGRAPGPLTMAWKRSPRSRISILTWFCWTLDCRA